MGDIGAPELLIIGIVIVLLFGATRLPATAKGLGQALRLFKKEIRADDEPAKPAEVAQPAGQLTSGQLPSAPPATAAPTAPTTVATPAPLPEPVVVENDPPRVVSR